MKIRGGIKINYYISDKEQFIFDNFTLSSCIREYSYNKETLSYINYFKIASLLNKSKYISYVLINKIREYINTVNSEKYRKNNKKEINEILFLYEGLENWIKNNLNDSYTYVKNRLRKKLIDKETFLQLELSIKSLDNHTKRLIEKKVNFELFERMVNWIQEIPYFISKRLFLDEIQDLPSSCNIENNYLGKYDWENKKNYEYKNI